MYNRYGCEVLCLTTQFGSFCWKVPVIFKVCNSLAKTKCRVQLHRFLSPFLRNSAWTSSRHHPHKEAFMRITGCPWPRQRSGAACVLYDLLQTCFLSITLQISPLEMTGKPVGLWPTTDISPVEQIWRENPCCTSPKHFKIQGNTAQGNTKLSG